MSFVIGAPHNVNIIGSKNVIYIVQVVNNIYKASYRTGPFFGGRGT
jgi:hypothetical protein